MTNTNSDNTVIILTLPGSAINNKKYNSICFRVGGLECCSINSPTLYSNTVCKQLPPTPLPPQPPFPTSTPAPPPGPCIQDIDLSGYTIEVNYNEQECPAGHQCNRAIFNVYINDIFIGKSNLNNGLNGGNVFTSFTIPTGITPQNNGYTINLVKDESIPVAHNGIAQVIIKDGTRVVYQSCLPNDNARFVANCPPPASSLSCVHSSSTPFINNITQTIESSSVIPSLVQASGNYPGPTMDGIHARSSHLGATLLENGKVFMIPWAHNKGIIYDPVTDTTTETVPTFSPFSYSGGVSLCDNRVMLIGRSGTIDFYNSNTDSISSSTINFTGRTYSGGVRLQNGKVFMIPRNSPAAVYDASNDSIEYVSSSPIAGGFFGGVLLLDGRVFCPPENSTGLIYNPTSNTVSSTNATFPGYSRHVGATLLPDGTVLVVPQTFSETILIWDPISDSIVYSSPYTAGGHAGALLLPNGKVLLLPRGLGLKIYDPVSRTISIFSDNNAYDISWQGNLGSVAYWGGVLLLDGRVFIMPDAATKPLIYGTVSGGTFDPIVTKSPYINHFNM